MTPLSASILELGRMLRYGTETPNSLLQPYMERITSVDHNVNAGAVRRFDGARIDADRATRELREGIDRGPLHGIPCTVKEFLAVEGMPRRFRNRLR